MGEIKRSPKSLENMIEFSKKVLGVKQVVVLTSRSSKGSGKQLIIGNIKQFDAENLWHVVKFSSHLQPTFAI